MGLDLSTTNQFLFYFYVPAEHKERVKIAVFEASGGKYNNYDCCSFEYEGVGQFRALEGAKPFIGNRSGATEIVREVKVEMLVSMENVIACKEALISAHPYEEVAYGFIPIYLF